MQLGSGYQNKDNSINMYLNAVPVPQKPGPLTLQLREVTEAELREREQRRASYSSRSTLDSSSPPFGSSGPAPYPATPGSASGAPYPAMPAASSVAAAQDTPF